MKDLPGGLGTLKGSLSFDRTACWRHFALRNDVDARREMSPVKAVSIAVLFLVGSSVVTRAATIEEVAHCRAIQTNSERWNCFKSLKGQRQGAPKAKREDTPKAKGEDTPKAKGEDTTSPIIRDAHETAPDDPASTSSIDHPSVTPGRPLCVDQDSLAAMLVAGVLASSPAQVTTNGCQTIPEDAQVELLQRYPSGLNFLRAAKVKVTSPTHPDPAVGYTVDISR
jgi:hypothetical protein